MVQRGGSAVSSPNERDSVCDVLHESRTFSAVDSYIGSRYRKTLSAPELRLKNDWRFLSRFTSYVRDLIRDRDALFQLFHVKRAFITLVKEENVFEMFDPQEPHSLILQQDEGLYKHTLHSPDGGYAMQNLAFDEQYVDAPKPSCTKPIRYQALPGTVLNFYAGKLDEKLALWIRIWVDTDLYSPALATTIRSDLEHRSSFERTVFQRHLLSGQIVQQIEEQHARRQARMHQVTIAFTNRSLQLSNTEDLGIFNTAHMSLPIKFPVLDSGSMERDSDSQFTSFVTPQPMGQKVETTLYKDALDSICQTLDDTNAVLLDLSRYDTSVPSITSPEPVVTPSVGHEAASEYSSTWNAQSTTRASLSRRKAGRRIDRDTKGSWSEVARYTQPSCVSSPFNVTSSQASAAVDSIILHTLQSDNHWFHNDYRQGELRPQILHDLVPDASCLLAIPVKQGKHSLLLMLSWEEVPTRPEDVVSFVDGILSSLVNTLSMRDARRAERAQLTFSNVQAHELRTPLHQIISTASLLRTELMEPLEAAGRPVNNVVLELLNNLESANTHLERNISSILGYFSSLAIDYTSSDAQVIADSLPSKTLGQSFEVTLPRLLQQNRAMRQHEDNVGDVDVIVDFVSIDDETHLLPPFSGGADDLRPISIRLEDNGIGMSQTFLQQDYFKAMGKQDEFSGGTGLSLYLAQELLHLMGGRIAVTSVLDKGTVVLIEIPLSQKHSSEGTLPTPGLTPTALRHNNFCHYATDETPSKSKPHSGIENSIRDNLLSSGLTICPDWTKSHLVLVPSNLPDQEVNRISTTFSGKEVWVIGPEAGWEKWKTMADKFDMLHLGNFIVSTTIRKLITVPQMDAPESSITPAMSRLLNPNFTLASTAVPTSKLKRSPLSTAGASISPDLNKPYIMVVDDNHINRKILVQYVKSLGLQTLQAEDGLVAVELFKKNHPRTAIILLDINMPSLNGYDACVQMRDIEAQDQGKPAYIVAVTALGRSDQRDRGLNECGMNDWVTKPTARELIVKKVVEGIAYLESLP
ncbi:hypothetical protein QFC22_004514 [Naganishia vaughanmartiniae]|uniref:Uncharacterized protein n=1 Tax=Naganishia vaughanmartiniae TaxID=1424756 RepID=A0ACC2WYY6_9TREE|nr:hypothetical protein QFC22_004514 [Naganishia vaughanmartiniae]